MLEVLQTLERYLIAIAEVDEVRWFLCDVFLSGKNLSFFATADDINDGDLTIFEGGVENNGDEFLIVDEVPDKVDVVVTAVDIDDGLEASILDISRFGDMFAFIDAILFF